MWTSRLALDGHKPNNKVGDFRMMCKHEHVKRFKGIAFCEDCKRVVGRDLSKKDTIKALAEEGFTADEIVHALGAQSKDQKKYIRKIYRKIVGPAKEENLPEKKVAEAVLVFNQTPHIIDLGKAKEEIEGFGRQFEAIILKFLLQLELLENTIKHLTDKVAELNRKIAAKGV